MNLGGFLAFFADFSGKWWGKPPFDG